MSLRIQVQTTTPTKVRPSNASPHNKINQSYMKISKRHTCDIFEHLHNTKNKLRQYEDLYRSINTKEPKSYKESPSKLSPHLRVDGDA